jgi:hypothetical protein
VDDAEDVDETVVWVRARGPQPLPLDGWDQASIWGWDETTGSLYAHLWHNIDDPAKPPAIRIGPGEYMPPIPFCATLAQHIAMATDSDPWEVLAALYRASDQGKDWCEEGKNTGASEGGTVVTMTEGYDIWWPPNFDPDRRRSA